MLAQAGRESVSDAEIRDAQRRAASGILQDEVRALSWRIRAAQLSMDKVELAAFCGSRAALAMRDVMRGRSLRIVLGSEGCEHGVNRCVQVLPRQSQAPTVVEVVVDVGQDVQHSSNPVLQGPVSLNLAYELR